MKKLNRDFFAKDTETVAKELLGKVLCRKKDNKIYRGLIVETEAYTQDDPACHAFGGISRRCESLFKKPGTAYVYLIYGMHHCVNLVTDKEEYGSGVLIRALEPLEYVENSNGPAKLCKSMDITKKLDGCDTMQEDSPIWIESGLIIKDKDIIQTTRIGISKAADLRRRFYIKNNKWVSKK